MRTYEGLFIFADSLRDEALEEVLNRTHGEITRLGGKVTATIPMGRRNFARPMKKRQAGLYYRIIFEMDPSQLTPLNLRLKINEDVFRSQIIQGDENTPSVIAAGTSKATEERTDG